jgi:hypothetical protein
MYFSFSKFCFDLEDKTLSVIFPLNKPEFLLNCRKKSTTHQECRFIKVFRYKFARLMSTVVGGSRTRENGSGNRQHEIILRKMYCNEQSEYRKTQICTSRRHLNRKIGEISFSAKLILMSVTMKKNYRWHTCEVGLKHGSKTRVLCLLTIKFSRTPSHRFDAKNLRSFLYDNALCRHQLSRKTVESSFQNVVFWGSPCEKTTLLVS